MNNSNYDHSLTSIFSDGLFRFLALILLFIALLLAQKNLILISLPLLTMFYTCKLWSYFSIKNVHYSFDAETKKGFPGEIISLQAQIYNNKILPIWLKLLIPMDKKLISEVNMKNNFLCEEFSLLWYDSFFWNLNLTAKQRGCFQIGPPFLETGDLMGFFQKRKYLSQSAVEVIIYPKPISLNFFSTPIKEFFGKTVIDSPVKDPIYPIATHDYQHGEPAKYIHWKASARYNHLQSKIFDPSTQRKTLLIIEVSSFQKKRQEELFEKILEVVAAMVLEFDKQGSPFSIFSNGKVTGSSITTNISFGTGPEQVYRAMELLARLTWEESCSMDEMMFKEMKITAGTGCIYCDYNINEKNMKISQFLKKYSVPVVYFMVAKASNKRRIDHIPILLLSEIYGKEIDLTRSDPVNI